MPKRQIQIQTSLCSISSIMRKKPFSVGMEDARANVFKPDTFSSTDDQWNYERGWAFANRQRRLRNYIPKITMEPGRRVVAFALQRACAAAFNEGSML